MDTEQNNIIALLTSLPDAVEYTLQPATDEQIQSFINKSLEQKVPQNVINQLTALYSVCNCYTYETVISFHHCTDELIYEWWQDDKELWLGQKDFYTLRWANGKFCLGDASNLSYGSQYEAATLVGLIEICINEINP